MTEYENREELIASITKYAKLFIDEFESVDEIYKDELINGVDRTPAQMIAYQLGWMKLILNWEKQELKGISVITPCSEYKWNNLGGLYQRFYKEYEEYTLKELCSEFIKIEQEVIELVKSYSEEELFQQGCRKWAASTPSNWPIWKWIHINTVAPFKSFRGKIRKWKKGL